ncbi:signal peptidase II [Caldicoprobacter guelmensis]|uniref:signal peptidase II n=1 Tax=Caldicoprobacter guelmensis TaxID=1170224 RepID=UPI00195864BF|nr:signal peptidase II [Caldicoprobacter guelmensis]MBM7581981.1 signal peptidase II [Caldicoprobacter guelmensis]
MLQIFIVAFIVVLDQVTKYLAKTYLKSMGSVPLIQNVFHFTYVENRGAAFGILQNQRWFFIALTVVTSVVIAYYLFARKQESIVFTIALSMILGGAIGNLIDRLRLGYVVDMLHFILIDYPVFNVADSCVVIGTMLLAYYVLFIANKKERRLN